MGQFKKNILENVKYLNSYGVIKDKNTVECTNKRGKVETLKTANILLAMGERPRHPQIPGIEHCISSDDLFSLQWIQKQIFEKHFRIEFLNTILYPII